MAERAIRTIPLLALAAIAALLAPACTEQTEPREVVLYYSADEFVARPIIAAFEDETGVRVRAVGDTEATKTTGLVQRLRSEQDAPRADVFWSSEVFLTIALASEGVLAPHESEAVADWPPSMRGPERRWHGFASRSRVICFNPDRVAPDEAPQTYHDLLDPRWEGRVVLARPEFGTTRGHMAALVELWGEDRAAEWMRALDDNGVRLLDGNATVVQAVASGEADVGLTDTDDVWSGQRNGWPVDLIYARHDLPDGSVEAGPLLIPNTAARVADGPNPDEAALLIDFLLSARVERMLAESDSHNIPVRESLAAEFPSYRVEDPARVDFEAVSEAMPAAMRLCEEAF